MFCSSIHVQASMNAHAKMDISSTCCMRDMCFCDAILPHEQFPVLFLLIHVICVSSRSIFLAHLPKLLLSFKA